MACPAAAVDSNTWTRNAFLACSPQGLESTSEGTSRNPAAGAAARQMHVHPLGYFGYRHRPDIFERTCTLSDGGHAENLGVFPLLQAGCKRILVVDAEHDPLFQFEGYFQLVRRLEEDGKGPAFKWR